MIAAALMRHCFSPFSKIVRPLLWQCGVAGQLCLSGLLAAN